MVLCENIFKAKNFLTKYFNISKIESTDNDRFDILTLNCPRTDKIIDVYKIWIHNINYSDHNKLIISKKLIHRFLL